MSAVPLIFNEALNVSLVHHVPPHTRDGGGSDPGLSGAWSYLWVFSLVGILRGGYGGGGVQRSDRAG
jgi:hypothetical protein